MSRFPRQAVAIGRAMAWARTVVLLDEPTNHLGVKEQGEVLELIGELRQRGAGIVLISHTLPHVLELADRIVTLRLGQVVSTRSGSDTTSDDLVRDITGLTATESPRWHVRREGLTTSSAHASFAAAQEQETECD